MLANRSTRVLPPLPTWARFALAGVIVACFAYVMTAFETVDQPTETSEPVEQVVLVPQLDTALLAEARDETRADRLQLETEPLRHLLAKAIDVGPTVAAALGVPAEPVPVDVLRRDLPDWRYRWLSYEGELRQLLGPKPGHPISGYSIYEATVRLPDGGHVLSAFSILPAEAPKVGDWVRVDGYLLKLRDVSYPEPIEAAPLLVGRTIQRDYEDWPPVTALDEELLASIDDSSYWPGDKPFHGIEEDQTEALWHLGAYARDTAGQRTLADWRRIGTLNVADAYDPLRHGEVARGTPMRIFGTLIRRRTIAAPPNPANIDFWTTAFVQVRDFGGQLIPVWVPKRVADLPMRAQLEIRGFYYRWFAYDAANGKRLRVPLFVAADLDTFELEAEQTMRDIGVWIGGFAILLLLLIIWHQRRMARTALAHSREMDARRRRRRERARARVDGGVESGAG